MVNYDVITVSCLAGIGFWKTMIHIQFDKFSLYYQDTVFVIYKNCPRWCTFNDLTYIAVKGSQYFFIDKFVIYSTLALSYSVKR